MTGSPGGSSLFSGKLLQKPPKATVLVFEPLHEALPLCCRLTREVSPIGAVDDQSDRRECRRAVLELGPDSCALGSVGLVCQQALGRDDRAGQVVEHGYLAGVTDGVEYELLRR